MSSPSATDAQPFIQAVQRALEEGVFVSLILSGPRGRTSEPSRFDVRPVELHSAVQLQWSSRTGKQVRHQNFTAEESLSRLEGLFATEFRNAVLCTLSEEIEARCTKRGKLQIARRAVTRPPPALEHNRSPQYVISEGVPCPFLAEIGVMTASGQVRAAQQHKFRQINRYLEFVRDILPDLPADGTLEVVDCGCGKSGLTFALQHFLTSICSRDVHLVGLDRNGEVLQSCRNIADRLGLSGIEFQAGDIAGYTPPGPVHLVVSLHACDTATDAALAQAIGWGAQVILAVPCCQHELAPQLTSDPLSALLSHGILRERFAADATDALRAALLETAGYRTQILEFIDLEHTPKNLLLRGVKRSSPLSESEQSRDRNRYQQLKSLLGVSTFALESMLEKNRLSGLYNDDSTKPLE